MLAAQIYREWHLGGLTTQLQASRVPRCLFGPPNPRETMEMLQEALNEERARFTKRWGIDPCAEDEDKENCVNSNDVINCKTTNNSGNFNNGKITMVKLTPSKRRVAATCPYAKQTSIQDYLRSKKIISPAKKFTSGALTEINPNQQSPSQQNLIEKFQSTTSSIKQLQSSPKHDRI